MKVDRILDKFLQQIGLTDKDALLHFNLAPLAVRRDIAMLGVLHRTKLGKGPKQFQDVLLDDEGCFIDFRRTIGGNLVQRSILGLIEVYTTLPQHCLTTKDVKCFQQRLQCMVREAAEQGRTDWRSLFSPRKLQRRGV